MVMGKYKIEDMQEIFNNAQETTACHLKNAILLKKIIDTNHFEECMKELIGLLQVFLLTDYKAKNAHYRKCAQFIVVLCKTLEPKRSENEEIEDHPIFLYIFDFFLKLHNHEKDSVRFWICFLISSILSNIDSLSDNLFDRIWRAMLERILLEPKLDIRLQAINCLVHFQKPREKEDEITMKFIKLLNDDSAKIRALVVEHIAISRNTLAKIANLTRDIDSTVRLKAFSRIGKFMKCIKITKRQAILRSAINESDTKVQAYFPCFLNIWLASYEGNYLKLIESIRLDGDDKDIYETYKLAEIILPKLFVDKTFEEIVSVLKLNADKLIDFENLNFESALYWRILVDYLNDKPEFEEITPECVKFCDFIHKNFLSNHDQHIEMLKSHKNFILKQLFLIAKNFDLSDNMSRGRFHNLISEMLEKLDLHLEVVDVLISNFALTTLSPHYLIVECCEIISTIEYSGKDQFVEDQQSKIDEELKSLRLESNNLQSMLDSAIKNVDFSQASELKCKIQENGDTIRRLEDQSQRLESCEDFDQKTTNVGSILRYMTIMHGLLRSPLVVKLTPEIQHLYVENIRDLLLHQNVTIKIKAFTCCTLVAILDKKIAQNIIHCFSVMIINKENKVCDELLIVCVKAVVDLLSVHGCDLLAESEGLNDSHSEEHLRIFVGGTSLTKLITTIIDLIDNESLELQQCGTEAICQLLLNNRIRSTSIIVRLILIWSSPNTDESYVRSYIGHTLAAFPRLPGFSKNLQEAIPLVMKTLVDAPRFSPLADVDQKRVGEFMIKLSSTSEKCSEIFCNVIEKILNEISEEPDADFVTIFSKVLLMINLNELEVFEDIIEEWMSLCDSVIALVPTKQEKNDLTKFKTKLSQLLSDDENMESDEEHDDTNSMAT